MSFSGLLHRSMIVGGLALALTTGSPSARANVFASNVKINGNGGMTNISIAQVRASVSAISSTNPPPRASPLKSSPAPTRCAPLALPLAAPDLCAALTR